MTYIFSQIPPPRDDFGHVLHVHVVEVRGETRQRLGGLQADQSGFKLLAEGTLKVQGILLVQFTTLTHTEILSSFSCSFYNAKNHLILIITVVSTLIFSYWASGVSGQLLWHFTHSRSSHSHFCKGSQPVGKLFKNTF